MIGGGARFRWHGNDVLKKLDPLIRRRAIVAGQQYERIWQRLLRGPKSGRVYRVGKTPTKSQRARGATFREHRASAPGEAPAINSGYLARSFRREIIRNRLASYTVRITWQASYMRFLEFGTSRMAARPSARPALRILYSQMRAIMNREARK